MERDHHRAAMIGGIDVGPVLVDITPHTLGISVWTKTEDGMVTGEPLCGA